MTTVDIRGINKNRGLRARVTRQMAAALSPLQVEPVAAQATFVDDNGPKGGPAIRCALTVRVPYRPSLRAEGVAETPRLAFDGAFAVLERQLERYRERDRDNRRHPKKYFIAKRLLTAGAEPARQRRQGGGGASRAR